MNSKFSGPENRKKSICFLRNTDLSALSANCAPWLRSGPTEPPPPPHPGSQTCCFRIYEQHSSDLRDANIMLIHVCRRTVQSHVALLHLEGGFCEWRPAAWNVSKRWIEASWPCMLMGVLSSMDLISAWFSDSLISFGAASPSAIGSLIRTEGGKKSHVAGLFID